MPHFADKKTLPFKPQQMFDMVADVAAYPEFLPWCKAARIFDVKDASFHADLIIGFMAFKERYTSHVKLESPTSVQVDYVRGPMKHLYNHWKFEAADGGCIVDFEVDFEFKNAAFEAMIGPLFLTATKKMIQAFEDRAKELYGVP